MLVRAHHLRLPQGFSANGGFCVAMSKSWAESHGLDWRKFVHEGIEGDVLRATGDPMAIAFVAAAEAQETASGR